MIKPINISPLNTSRDLEYRCNSCGKGGTMHLENTIVNTDNNGNPVDELDYDCRECGKKL